jgi:hypothetical protein
MGNRALGGLAVAACLLLFSTGATAANSSEYVDASGDAPAAAPDLTAVQVSNDDAGTLVFRISIPNRASLEDSDLVSVFVDADAKVGTGCARGTFGAEYSLSALGRSYLFGRCVRGRWSFGRRPPSFAGSFTDSTLNLRASRRVLGGTSGLAFRIGAAALSGDAAYDFAPDVGTAPWGYRVLAPRRTLEKSVKRWVRACVRHHPCRRR